MLYTLLENITHLGLQLIEQAGYSGIFAISFLENVFTPIPSEAIIPFAGILVAQNRLDLIPVILAATLGSLTGAYVFYSLGYLFGSNRIRQLIIRYGRYFFIRETDLNRAQIWFEKYEDWAILICRVIPLVRSFISIPAGYVKMPLVRFTLLTTLGTGIWSIMLVYLGIILGQNYTRLIPIFRQLDLIFGIAIILLAGYYFFQRTARKSEN